MKKLLLSLLIIVSFCGLGLAQKTIEPELQEVLDQKGGEMINVNIILKSQVDVSTLRSRAEQVTDKKTRRDVLVDDMKLFAEKEQSEIMSILRAEEKSSRVSDVKSGWLVNYINCNASRDVIYLLAEHPDVMMVGYNQEKYMLWNEKSEDVEPTRNTITQNITTVNADKVWDLGLTGNGVIVAVIDSGVNYNHVDLADHLWDGGAEFPHHGYDVYYNDNDPMDNFGHGTHCAGTVCGDGTSGTTTGMAPNATLMCVKCLNDDGGGSAATICSGMEWAVEHHADVMSLSLGIPNSSVAARTLLRQTCVNALELGVVAAIANGNEGDAQWMYPVPNNVRVPGSCPPPWLHPDQADINPGELSCVVAVGATDYNDVIADFSSVGPVTWQNTEYADYAYLPGIGLIRPDVCAPGVNVVSLNYASNTGLATMSGTSMATPCVAGVMALMLEKNTYLTPAEICMILETTAHKISPDKNNTTGSGRIDALAAIEAVVVGDFKLITAEINDSNIETGNDNAHLNPSEQVKFNVAFENASENNYNNITVVLSTKNEMVTIIDSIAQISSIEAYDTINIIDEFEFVVDENIEAKSTISFDLNFYDGNNESRGLFIVPVDVYGNKLEFSSVIIKNDDNNNGMLEAGETADLGVIFNNAGNEIAVAVNAILSSEDSNIIINTNESSFSSIADESSGVAFFNVTMSDNISDIFSIPFEIELTEYLDENPETYTFSYSSSCNVIFELKDTYGDGWNGASLTVRYSDGTPDDTFTIDYGYNETYTRTVNSGVELILEWSKGSYDTECSLVVRLENGTTIYQGGNFSNGIIYSWIHDCYGATSVFSMCESVQNLTLVTPQEMPYPASFTWEAPASEDILHYEIYRNSRFMGITEELSYTDETTADSVCYIYSIRPIYEDCDGLMSHIEIHYIVDINENSKIKASIYPNPSNDNFNIVCENMTRITVYNVMGAMILDAQVNDNRYTVSDLNAGVYFINIHDNDGNVVTKKVVKVEN